MEGIEAGWSWWMVGVGGFGLEDWLRDKTNTGRYA